MMRKLCLLGGSLLLLAPGCAGRAAYFLVDATRTYQEARDADAEERAVYEFTLAGEYLQKAREEVGYSDYQAAEKLARRAAEEAVRAKEIAEEGGVAPADTKDVPDEAKLKPAAPAPSPTPDIEP